MSRNESLPCCFSATDLISTGSWGLIVYADAGNAAHNATEAQWLAKWETGNWAPGRLLVAMGPFGDVIDIRGLVTQH
jgi:hypothetical protein